MNPFQYFLDLHQIEPLRLSIIARVRYLTVWNALHGKPITEEHAANIRVALRSLTGTSYTGTLQTIKHPSLEDQSPLPLNQWKKGSRAK